MGKKIQDYLHLYIGCVMEKSDESGQFILTPHSFSQMLLPGTSEYIKQARPLLRPLSSMTDEELQECGNLDYDFSDDTSGLDLNNHKWQDFETILTANQFHWLISRGFDLFDLIPSGLAIDKTLHPSTIS